MGLFLALSGVIGTPALEVQHTLKDFAALRSGSFELAEGTTNDPNIGIITYSGPNTTIMYPNGFIEWDDASQHISQTLQKPVFSLHIHDGDLWMYILFHKGEEIGRFNPLPEYWKELEPEEKQKWRGDANIIANLVKGVTPYEISKYFVEWDPDKDDEVRAYPDDEYPVGNCWQMVDFMRRIGLEYPMTGNGSILGDTFRLWTKKFKLRLPRPIKQASAPTKQMKPWWKFW